MGVCQKARQVGPKVEDIAQRAISDAFAPLLEPHEINVVEVLHPVIETALGKRIVATERLAAISPRLLGAQMGSLLENAHNIGRAIDRVFFGN